MLGLGLVSRVQQLPRTTLAVQRLQWRSLTTAFEALQPDVVRVPVGSSGTVSIDIYHPPRPVHPTPVVICFPRGPLASTAPLPPTNLSPLAIAANVTVVNVNYRLSRDRSHPSQIHDALASYDWIKKHLASGSDTTKEQGRIGVCGELVGGTIAAALGLTECHTSGTGVRGMLLGNPIADWTAMHPVLPDGKRPLASTPAPPKPRKRAASRVKAATGSWETYATDPLLPTTELLKARGQLFKRAEDYFDPFCSPMLFFRTPSSEVPGASDPLDEIFAEMEGIVRPMDKKRKSARKYPPQGSDLTMPATRIWVGRECVLRDQGVELGKAVEKAAGPGKVGVEALKDTGLWGPDELMEIGRWFGYILRS